MLRVFHISCGIILALTGLAKLYSVLVQTRALEAFEPVFGIQLQRLFLVAGLVELLVALFLLLTSASLSSKAAIVLWLSLLFVCYRIETWSLDWTGGCPCLGSISVAWHMSDHLADLLAKSILGYMLIGSVVILCIKFALPPFHTRILDPLKSNY